MNNEPVAWVDPYDLERLPHYDCHIGSQKMKNGIPLYTHPVSQYKAITNTKIEPTVVSYTHPVKELTDEEILEICDLGEWHKDEFAIQFARAILRKAQEK